MLVLSVIVLIKAQHAIGAPFHAVDNLGFRGSQACRSAWPSSASSAGENSGPLGEESRNPRRTIPRTVVISILLVMVVLFVSAYALVVGFAGWRGTHDGIRILASGELSAPY